MNINYNSLFKALIPYLIVILAAILLDFILYLYLPKTAQNYEIKNENSLEYKRFEIQRVFKVKRIKQVKKKVLKKENYTILNNINLLAIYAMNNNSGYIIIQERNRNETIILSKDENFKNYKLKEIYRKYVIFIKNKKEYKLSINDERKSKKYQIIKEENSIKTVTDINVYNDKVTIKRELINNYIENFDKIWQDISISEVKTLNGIDGFKVNSIKKNTAFDRIGLKKYDIIKSINNIKLKSYNDAFKIYKKINKIKSLNIEILRNNKPLEVYYEIK
jgi:general secretion pathway protein C